MKSILISIKPKWVAKILNGEKTIEIRKTMPKCDLPIDVYIYCTKEDSLCCIKRIDRDRYICGKDFDLRDFPHLSSGYDGKGKVVAKFTLNKVVPIVMQMGADTGYGNNGYVGYGHCEKDNFKFMFDMEKETCLEHNEELCKYLNNGKNFDDIYINKLKANNGYAWHISNLVIFDRPKELSEFYLGFRNKYYKREFGLDTYIDKYGVLVQPTKNGYEYTNKLTKAPQSFMYVEELL